MAKSYIVTKYLITVINNVTGKRSVHTEDEIIGWLREEESHFYTLLHWQYLSFECDEDYGMFGLQYPHVKFI